MRCWRRGHANLLISCSTPWAAFRAPLPASAVSDPLLIAVGGIIGSAGYMLTRVSQCKAMNRRLMPILLGEINNIHQKARRSTRYKRGKCPDCGQKRGACGKQKGRTSPAGRFSKTPKSSLSCLATAWLRPGKPSIRSKTLLTHWRKKRRKGRLRHPSCREAACPEHMICRCLQKPMWIMKAYAPEMDKGQSHVQRMRIWPSSSSARTTWSTRRPTRQKARRFTASPILDVDAAKISLSAILTKSQAMLACPIPLYTKPEVYNGSWGRLPKQLPTWPSCQRQGKSRKPPLPGRILTRNSQSFFRMPNALSLCARVWHGR